jgi:signal transduction histidine kinase/ActR/RegA family two-component response regulator
MTETLANPTHRPAGDGVICPFEVLAGAAGGVAWRARADGFVEALGPPELTQGMEAWAGQGWRQVIHHEDAMRVAGAWRGVTQGGIVEFTCRARKGNEYRWFRVRGARVHGAGGEYGWVGLITDIDADAREREELARSEQAYRAIVKATAALVWRWTPEGGIIDGDGWGFPTNYEGDEWLGAVHADDRERVRQDWVDARAAEIGYQSEFRARTAAGDFRWCVSRAVPVRNRAGLVTEWVGALIDVHDERLARETLQRKDKLEAVGRLTAGVAHDFNNLLTVITAGAEALVDRLPAGHPLRGDAELALHAAERGAELVNRLLTTSRQQSLQPKPVETGAALDALATLVRRTLGEDLDVRVRPAAQPLWCVADPVQLESALLNLCINARDAMPGGGRLSLEAALGTLPEAARSALGVAPGSFVTLSVQDSGAGMSPDVLEHALEPFFTTKDSGSGLGLSMVYGFTRQSGGHFTIASRPGRGTRATLFLPQCAAPAVVPAKAEPVLRGVPAHILMVEDDHLVRDQLARQLRALGFRVTPVADGRSALSVLSCESRIALLMTDVVIPGGLNGRQLADQARLLRPDLPVLFTSGYTDDAIVREGRLGPGSAFLPKPYRRAQLAAAIGAVLGSAADSAIGESAT